MRGVLGTAPWRRAPLLLLRHPPVLAAVAGAAMVLGSAAAVGPVFLSSAGSAAVSKQVASRCAFDAGVTVSAQATGVSTASGGPPVANDYALLDRRSTTVSQAAQELGHLEGPVLQLTAPLQAISLQSGPHGDVRLLYRQGALNQVQKLADAGGGGVWITNTFAGLLALHPGDRFQLAVSDGASVATVRVRGIYRDMEYLPKSAYWCADQSLISPPSIFSEVIPAPLILADEATYEQISRSIADQDTIASWAWTLAPRLTIDQATKVVGGLPKFQQTIERRSGPFSTAVPFRTLLGGQEVVEVHSDLPFITARASAIRGAVRAGTTPASSAGLAVSLLLVAVAGSYWVDRRRNEVTMLAARGVGRTALGLKATLETAPAAGVGVAAGTLAAVLLVRLSGPSQVIAQSALRDGVIRAVAAGAVAVALLGAVAAARAAMVTERPAGTRRSRLRFVPFELVAVGSALFAYGRLRTIRPALSTPATRVPPVDSVLLLFPLLFLAGLVGVELRLTVFGLGRLRRRGWAWAHSLFFAARRLAAAPAAAALLVGASALSIGVLVYSATLTGSVRATLTAKAKVFVGSDLAVTLHSGQPLPASLSGRATVVRRVLYATGGGQPVDLVGIDPSTFAHAAFWDSSFATPSLSSLVHRLTPSRISGALPVLLANGAAPPDGTIAVTVEATTVRIPITVVGRARTFPGEHYGQPIFVADWSSLAPTGVVGTPEAWVRGAPTTALAALRQAQIPATFVVDAATVLDGTDFLTSSWTFGYLRALGILTGLMTIGGMLLYLESRQRGRKVAYAVARRMGLRRTAHAASIATELAATLGPGLVAGAVLASVAAGLTYSHVDSAPLNPPTPLLLLPWSTYAAVAVAVAVVIAAGTWLSQRSADRTRIAQELRVAE